MINSMKVFTNNFSNKFVAILFFSIFTFSLSNFLIVESRVLESCDKRLDKRSQSIGKYSCQFLRKIYPSSKKFFA